MITRNAFLFIGLSVFATANAQVDWTATDINGNTWNLQDLLDQGKTVVVDVATLGCPGRTGWHNEGVLQKVQREFGPGGSDDMMCFWVAVDNPTLAQLQNHAGHDFTADAPYAIIGPNGQGTILSNAYNYTGGVHLYAHCPGSTTFAQGPHDNHWFDMIDDLRDYCPAPFDNGAIDIRLMEPEYSTPCADGHAWVALYNQGTTPINSATLTLEKDGQLVETYQWSGSISTLLPWDFQFPTTILEPGHTYVAHASVPGEITTAGNSAEVQVIPSVAAPSSILTLQVATDAYPEQFGWEIRDENSNTVLQRWNGFYTEPNDTVGLAISLDPDKCYTFRAWDTADNGICCNNGNGFFRLKNRFGPPIFFIQGGDFDEEQEFVFHTPAEEPSAVSEHANQQDLHGYPNPTTGPLHFDAAMGQAMTVDVHDALGACVLSRSWTNTATVRTIDLGAFNNGVYVLTVRTADAISTQRVLLSK